MLAGFVFALVLVANAAATQLQVAAGGLHTCAVVPSGSTVDCWGENKYGELGDGNTESTSLPVEVLKMGASATQVVGGEYHSCALLSTEHIDCWGANGNGELGDGKTEDTDAPVEVQSITSATQLAAGEGYTCALLSGHGVACWGANGAGQLGDGNMINSDKPVEVPVSATQLAAGGEHTCAVLSNGHVDCWGWNANGQLGDGNKTERDSPVEVKSITTATQVAAGYAHTCALLSSGHVDCWGWNGRGQLGDGNTTETDEPVEVKSISTATQLAAGEAHTCALLSSGHIECWGEGEFGQLGDGKFVDSETPVEVQSISGVTQLSASRVHTCAVLSTHHVDCWGDDEYGELGDGKSGNSNDNTDTPTEVLDLVSSPVVVTGAALEVTTGTVVFHGTVNPEGEEVTSCVFEYGLTASYGLGDLACSPPPGSGEAPVQVSRSWSGLSANTTYHFRLAATNIFGTSDGADATFTTLGSSDTGETTKMSEPAKAKDEELSAEASGGTGSVTVGAYGSDIGGPPLFAATAPYADASRSSASTFTKVEFKDCELDGAKEIWWFDPTAGWRPVSNAVYSESPAPPCITVTVTASTSPSLAQLEGTRFGLVSFGAQQYGKCEALKHGQYGNAECTTPDLKNGVPKGKYEWYAATSDGCFAKKHGFYAEDAKGECKGLDEKKGKGKGAYEKGANAFRASGGPAKFEIEGASTVECQASTQSGGALSEPKIGATTVTFTGCKQSGTGCQSGEAAETIVSEALHMLIYEEKEKLLTGLTASVISEGTLAEAPTTVTPLMSFRCGSAHFVVDGEVSGETTGDLNKMSAHSETAFRAGVGYQGLSTVEGQGSPKATALTTTIKTTNLGAANEHQEAPEEEAEIRTGG